jgi:hypothetical protein
MTGPREISRVSLCRSCRSPPPGDVVAARTKLRELSVFGLTYSRGMRLPAQRNPIRRRTQNPCVPHPGTLHLETCLDGSVQRSRVSDARLPAGDRSACLEHATQRRRAMFVPSWAKVGLGRCSSQKPLPVSAANFLKIFSEFSRTRSVVIPRMLPTAPQRSWTSRAGAALCAAHSRANCGVCVCNA